jgi:proteasome lid subunit RPN8/RPN11
MDAVHTNLPEQRLPDAVPPSGAYRAGDEGDYPERPMPLAAAVRWVPFGDSTGDSPYPIFIAQTALAVLQHHAKDPPQRAASFGFLVGAVCVAPETHTPYVVVESAIHSGWSMAGDDLKAALIEGRSIVEDAVPRTSRRVVGWYQTHVAADSRLSAADVEAHVACFDQPWHFAMVMAVSAGLSGGVFRPVQASAGSDQYLPFYEVLEGHSSLPDGRGVTTLAWENYRVPGVVVPSHGTHSERARPPRVLFADEQLDDDELAVEALRRAPPRRTRPRPVVRVAGLGALGIAAVAAMVGAYQVLASGVPGDVVAGQPASAAVTAGTVDRLGDTVAFAAAAFDLRARLFAAKKMGCADLARGLVELEQRWITYTAARKIVAARPDAAPLADDLRLHSDVGAVEQRFARTGCPRP